MSYKKLLAVVGGQAADLVVLDAALAMARRFGAEIEVFHPEIDPAAVMPFGGDPFGMVTPALYAGLAQEGEDRAKLARGTFEKWRAQHRLRLSGGPDEAQRTSASWSEAKGLVSATLPVRGRLSDAIVVGQIEDADAPMALTVETALFGCGRPVLYVPTRSHLESIDKVAVLWNGSSQAARAAGDALSIMKQAGSVAVIASGEPVGGPNAAKFAEYLKCHGIEADLLTAEPDGDIGSALLREATEFGADLIVMGAYGHTRVREFLLGGVTRHVLRHVRRPVLMSH